MGRLTYQYQENIVVLFSCYYMAKTVWPKPNRLNKHEEMHLTQNYIIEAMSQWNKFKYYEPIAEPIYKSTFDEVQSILAELRNKGLIDQSQLKFLYQRTQLVIEGSQRSNKMEGKICCFSWEAHC